MRGYVLPRSTWEHVPLRKKFPAVIGRNFEEQSKGWSRWIMGAKITTEIDPYIKQVYESMKDKLGVTYKEILEEGILAKIKDVDPIKVEEIEIMRLEFQLSAHKMHLATLKVSSLQLKEKTATTQNTNGIESEREKWFRKKAPGLAKAIDEEWINWPHVAKNGPFKSAQEAKEWVLNHLPEWRQSRED
jgi:hypothetical protein